MMTAKKIQKEELHPLLVNALEVFGTQAEIARQTGLSKQRISHWFVGRNEPDGEGIIAIQKAIIRLRGDQNRKISENPPVYGRPTIFIAETTSEKVVYEKAVPTPKDLTFYDGKVGRWAPIDAQPGYWTFMPLDGSNPQVCEGIPFNIVLGKLTPIEPEE